MSDTSREKVLGEHDACSKSDGSLGCTPQLMYPIFVWDEVKSKARDWKNKDADMVNDRDYPRKKCLRIL